MLVVEVLDACFQSKEPSISQVSSLSVICPSNVLSLTTVHVHKQYVALSFGNGVVLWDIKEDRYSQWLDAVTRTAVVLPTENFVVSFGSCGLSAWKTDTQDWRPRQDADPAVDLSKSSPETSQGILNPHTPFYTAGSLPLYQLCFTFDLYHNDWMSHAFVSQSTQPVAVSTAHSGDMHEVVDYEDNIMPSDSESGIPLNAPDASDVAL
ncbi:hypothetical protein FA13DRAFT_1799336 [Coprinellus micaceus]|uniref:Uncharacterized protein n=1 Tax=Coprinellus micaceus TaxID=71717 RepID=A0A4Y7SJD9_COPMI|nr:hypothetical protein FA13DRAFT_1799336 [Coprinellus micaceus]